MRKSLVACALMVLCAPSGQSQIRVPDSDPRVEKVVREISPSNIRAVIHRLVGFGTRHTLSDTTSADTGIGAARRWIASEFERYAANAGARMTVALDGFTIPASQRVPRPTVVYNVVATLHPADESSVSAKRTIVVGGHYDSRATDILDSTHAAPGADDDGSGTAVVLELARVLSREDLRATVVFICFAGEEQGLFGSLHWAHAAQERGLNIEAVFNNDIVGGVHGGNGESDSTTVRVFSEAFSPLDTGGVFARRNALGLENDGPSRSLARYIKDIGRIYLPDFSVRLVYRRDRFLRGGDHMSFHEVGMAAVRFTEAKEDFDHQHQNVRLENGRVYGDLEQFVNPAYCANVARINAAAVATLAFAPSPPSAAGIVVSGLSYGTELRWERNTEPGVAGYIVRWRETSAPAWQFMTFTADTAIALKASKDDFLFGVQAVNREGDRSLVSIPLPIR